MTNYPNQRRPITPTEERHAETHKRGLLEFANSYKAKAVAANHPQAELFTKVVDRISGITDPYWFLDRRRRTAKDVMNEVAKEILGK